MLNKWFKWLIGSITLIFFISAPAFADVNVVAEGTYSDTQLTVEIYVDTTDATNGAADPLVSYGVKLLYAPADLADPVVTKNETDWYFGSAASPLPTPNADPDTTVEGQVVIVGGKIDSADPTAGVSGPKVLLATVVFERISTDVPDVTLDLGKAGSYANFVTREGDVLDGTNRIEFLAAAVSPECSLEGNLNGDNIVNMEDFYIIQSNWGQAGENIADINNDNIVNMEDFYVIQSNWGTTCP